MLTRRGRLPDLQHSRFDRERRVRGSDENVVWICADAVSGFDHRHGCMGTQQLREHSSVVRVQMLYQHEGHT
jgi:hypothetical protein